MVRGLELWLRLRLGLGQWLGNVLSKDRSESKNAFRVGLRVSNKIFANDMKF